MVFITSEVFAENEIYTIKPQKRDGSVVLRIRIKNLNKKLGLKMFLSTLARR